MGIEETNYKYNLISSKLGQRIDAERKAGKLVKLIFLNPIDYKQLEVEMRRDGEHMETRKGLEYYGIEVLSHEKIDVGEIDVV